MIVAAVNGLLLLAAVALSLSMTAAGRSANSSDPSQPAPAIKGSGVHSTLALLSDQTVKDFFDSAISKAYYVIEVSLSKDGASGFAVTGLELHFVDGDSILPTPASFVALQMSRNKRKLMPAKFVSEVVLVPNAKGVRTWLFVEKKERDRLRLVNGQLPPGLQLFGNVSETLFVKEAIP